MVAVSLSSIVYSHIFPSPSPYFALEVAKIQTPSPGTHFLTVGVLNDSDIEATDVVTRLLVLKDSLNPTQAPILQELIEEANPVSPGKPVAQHCRLMLNRIYVLLLLCFRFDMLA